MTEPVEESLEVRKARSRYNAAIKRVQSGLDARNGGPGAEAEVAIAYQDLVRLGVEAPLGLKYVHGRAVKLVR